VINLKNNSHIFSILITSKEALRFKDNLEASTKNVQRNSKDMFIQDDAIATDRAMLESRAFSLRKKAAMLNKQVNAYEQMTAQMNEEDTASEKTEADKHDMTYIDDVLTLNRKKFNRYIHDHEKHLIATAEKLRSEMTTLTTYVHHADKRLRDQIQLKIVVDLKLCRDIKTLRKFEMKT